MSPPWCTERTSSWSALMISSPAPPRHQVEVFSVSIYCSAMSSDIFSVSRWLKQGSFSWIWKCFNLSTFRRLRNSSKIISSLLIFAGIRTVQNDHLWLISPNWIKAGSLQRTLVLQLICECHSPAQRFVLVPIFVKISLWWCRLLCPG